MKKLQRFFARSWLTASLGLISAVFLCSMGLTMAAACAVETERFVLIVVVVIPALSAGFFSLHALAELDYEHKALKKCGRVGEEDEKRELALHGNRDSVLERIKKALHAMGGTLLSFDADTGNFTAGIRRTEQWNEPLFYIQGRLAETDDKTRVSLSCRANKLGFRRFAEGGRNVNLLTTERFCELVQTPPAKVHRLWPLERPPFLVDVVFWLCILPLFCFFQPIGFEPADLRGFIHRVLRAQATLFLFGATAALIYGLETFIYTAWVRLIKKKPRAYKPLGHRAARERRWEERRTDKLLDAALEERLISKEERDELLELQFTPTSETQYPTPHPRLADVWIRLLDHHKYIVRQQASVRLRKVSGQSFGFVSNAPRDERKRTIREWRAWLEHNKQKLADEWKKEREKQEARRKRVAKIAPGADALIFQ